MNLISDYIKTTVQYIEDNIEQKLDLNIIAENINLSKYHLHRLMTAAAGRPLMEYVRARKLALSLDKLINTNLHILDIANEYSFDFEQSYIRAFKKEYGITPNKFRRGNISVGITEKISLSQFEPMENGVVFNPFYIYKPIFFLVGVKYYIGYDENYINNTAAVVGNDFFFNKKNDIVNSVNKNVYMGLTRWTSEDIDISMYMPSSEVYSIKNIPSGMCAETIVSNKYAVFRYIGDIHPRHLTYQHLEAIKRYIYEKWTINLGYSNTSGFEIEYIDTGFATENYCEVDIYVPLKNSAEISPHSSISY